MKTSDVLRGAANLLKTKGHCKGSLALTRHGLPTSPINPRAASLCARGAICAALGTGNFYISSGERSAAEDVVLVTAGLPPPGFGCDEIVHWNNADARAADEVISAFDAAYVLALQEEGTEPEDVLG